MILQSPKGTRDFLPEEKILRQEIEDKLKTLFELYGYNPLETPAFELFETLSSKYAGGAEILKEMYTFEDQGKRKLGLRYDLTVPFARVIAMNPNLKKPFKRYQIGKVFRDGPMKAGRYREFEQCDVDMVGTASMIAEAELLAMASSFFEQINLDVTISINNRKLTNALLSYAEVPEKLQDSVILSLDKLKKIGRSGVLKELEEKNIKKVVAEKVLDVFSVSAGTNDELIKKIKKFGMNDGIEEIESVLEYTKSLGVNNIRFDPSLARGLSYYTGTVYEVFLSDNSFSSSLAAGGRYDNMIGDLISSKEKIPAVGLSFGLDAICDVLKMKKLVSEKKSLVQVYIIPIKTVSESLGILATVRSLGMNADMDMNDRSISKNLEYANAFGIPYVVIVGKSELDQKKVKLKNMKTGEEKFVSVSDVKKEVK